jgi:hypothetical protein
MRAGESVQVTMTKGSACNGFPFGNLTLKIFESACDAACNCPVPTTCTATIQCLGGNQNTSFTATKDAWYTFVVDSESSPSGSDPAGWIMTFSLKLTCAGGNCAC